MPRLLTSLQRPFELITLEEVIRSYMKSDRRLQCGLFLTMTYFEFKKAHRQEQIGRFYLNHELCVVLNPSTCELWNLDFTPLIRTVLDDVKCRAPEHNSKYLRHATTSAHGKRIRISSD